MYMFHTTGESVLRSFQRHRTMTASEEEALAKFTLEVERLQEEVAKHEESIKMSEACNSYV